uniref:EGF-like domain-containing protein n=1 Tax=Alexandrium monilatum TaxID=311494 RepID=A0A7S4RXN8_9DINO
MAQGLEQVPWRLEQQRAPGWARAMAACGPWKLLALVKLAWVAVCPAAPGAAAPAAAARVERREAAEPPVPRAEALPGLPFLPLPPCKQHYWLAHLAEQSGTWCDPRSVPPEVRAPAKLQGLFWLNGLPLPDVAACFSRGIWNKQRLTLRVNVWSDFVFRDNTVAEAFESAIFSADMHYVIQFHDEALSNATLHPEGSGINALSMKVFDVVSDFPMVELRDQQAPGDKWQRPSYFGLGNFKVKGNDYALWRILDGGLRVVHDNARAMVAALDPWGQGVHLMRFSADCLSAKDCGRDTGVTCNILSCSKWRGKAECVRPGFMWHCVCQAGHCAVNGRCMRAGGVEVERLLEHQSRPGGTVAWNLAAASMLACSCAVAIVAVAGVPAARRCGRRASVRGSGEPLG